MLRSTAIILSAGYSTRMGRCKASLPWHQDQTLLTYQVTQFQAAGVQPVVVLGMHNAHHQLLCPAPCMVAVNPNPTQGKVSSILVGLRHLPDDWDVVFVSAVDQPRSASIYSALLESATTHPAPITMPVWGDRPGHPALFSRALQPDLMAIRDETLGLRHVVQFHRSAIQYVALASESIFLDLNTPEQYANALRHNTTVERHS